MVFSSFIFLFLFLPVSALLYAASPRSLQNTTLLMVSIFFYAWGAPQILPLLLIACIFDYSVSFFLVPNRITERVRRKLFALAIICNLATLLYYKYFTFFATEISRAFLQVGIESPRFAEILLPIGISFFTFHKISYLGDIYRGKVVPARSIIDYLLYIFFFPQLIAGPIIRYADVAHQFSNRIHTLEGTARGLTRLCMGLGKKVLIADSLGTVADQIWSMDHSQLSAPLVWLAAFTYSFQIYFDFSGYSDMAIGLAKLFGFTFKENFNQPYRAYSFTDFWRRWHISLSNFMREYLYIPLGGNRRSTFRTALNLWTTFLLSGLWHGAAWNFISWGAFHGAFLTIDKLGWEKIADRLPKFVALALTFSLVTIGWVFFRSHSLREGFSLVSIMFGFGDAALSIPRAYIIDNRQLAMLALAIFLAFPPHLTLKRSAPAHPVFVKQHKRVLPWLFFG